MHDILLRQTTGARLAARVLFALLYVPFCVLFCAGSLTATAWGQGSVAAPEGAAEAAAALANGQLPRAISLYQALLQTNPGWVDGWWFLGNLDYQTDQYQAAREALGHFIELAPNATAALALRGLCGFELGDYTASLADIERSLASGSASQQRNGQILLYHEALVLTRLGRYEDAIAKYTAFIKEGVINDDIGLGMGLAGLRLPLLPREATPDQRQQAALAGQAATLLLTGDTAGGHRVAQQLLTQFPGTPYVHYFCGYLLLTKDPGEAITEFDAELAQTPESALTNAMLAWTLELRGDYAEALPHAQQAVGRDPGVSMDQLVLGRALLETTGPTEALPHLRLVEEAEPANLEAHLGLARAYSELGQKDDARRERLLSLQLAHIGEEPHATP